MTFKHDESVGGVPVEVITTRRETVWIEMDGAVRLIETILEDKAIECVKKAMAEYIETLVSPWSYFDDTLTVSTAEIVAEMEGPNNFPLIALLGGTGLMRWEYDHAWSSEKGYTGVAWSLILDKPIAVPTFADAMVMWQEAVMDRL